MPQMSNQVVSNAVAFAKSDRGLFWVKGILIVIFAVWMLSSLSRLVWVLITPPALEVPVIIAENNTSSRAVSKSSAESADYSSLNSTKLFGKVDSQAAKKLAEQPQVAPVEVENAKPTSLNLTLTGVIESSDPAKAQAIIVSGRVEQAYNVKDKLPVGRNVTLQQVLNNRVIINNNGRAESLWLFDPSKKTSAVQSRPVTQRQSSVTTTMSSRPSPRASSAQKIVAADKESEQLVSQEQTDDGSVTHKIRKLPSSLAEVIRFGVARDGGEIVGYKIRPGRNADMFTALGLEHGDIVTEVNGISLTSSGSISQVYREMREATSAEVTLLRDGQTETRVLELELDE